MSVDDSDIFLIDDDDFVRDALRALLKSAGFSVKTFESAEVFLTSKYQQHKGLLVLDVRMPGMSGIELQKRLSEYGIDNPIVFITAYADAHARAEAEGAGAVAFLQKPFEDYDLLCKLLIKIIKQINPRYKYATELVTTLIASVNKQIFYEILE